MVKKKGISLACMDYFLRKLGAKRISPSGKTALKKAAENYVERISGIAIKLAKHGKRDTIRDVDIELALKEIKE